MYEELRHSADDISPTCKSYDNELSENFKEILKN